MSMYCPPISRPVFQCGAVLPCTESYKYSGHAIISSLTDDADIMKQTRSNKNAKANMIVGKFSECSMHTRLMIFRQYCTSLYVWLSAEVSRVPVFCSLITL